jgi:hypothetical protein
MLINSWEDQPERPQYASISWLPQLFQPPERSEPRLARIGATVLADGQTEVTFGGSDMGLRYLPRLPFSIFAILKMSTRFIQDFEVMDRIH